ncbi:MAG: FecR family protein [Firmicutes bacterium]|nr:FecR family protein [Bacillota bacterium]
MSFQRIASFLVFILFISQSLVFARMNGQNKRLKPVPDFGYVGNIVYVKKKVTAKHDKTKEWVTAYQNMPNYLYDKIKTGDHSHTTLEFKDGTQVGINQNTEVYIDTNTTVKNITKETFLKRIFLDVGSIWCKVTKQKENESFTVQTRGGVLGVRGTQFAVSTTGNNRMKVYVIEGTVMAGPSVNQLTQAIPAGYKATIERGKVIQEIEIGAGIAHIVADALGAPWYAHWGIDIGAGLAEGAPPQQIAINAAEDAAVWYIPYGGYGIGIARIFGFGGPPKPPPQPANLQPVGMVYTYTPTFSWSGIPGAKQYEVLVSRTPFQKQMPKSSWVWIARVDKNFVQYPETATFLMPGTTYWWTVAGLTSNGKLAGREAYPVQFTMGTESMLGKRALYPTLLTPNNQELNTVLPDFSWNPFKGAKGYALLLGAKLKNGDLDNNFAVATIKTNNTDLRYQLSNPPLEPGKTYYWSVVPLDSQGNPFTRPAPPFSFTLPSAYQAGPTPVYPVTQMKQSQILHFEWRSWVSNISGYRLVVSQNQDLSDPILVKTTTAPWVNIRSSELPLTPGQTYYWAVSNISLTGIVGASGQTASFQVSP